MLSGSANELILLLNRALQTHDLFPAIDLSASLDATNIRRFLQSKAIITLQKLFTTANLTPRIGYNFSTREISFTFSIVPTNTSANNEDKLDETSKQRSIVLWSMLGIHKEQQELEKLNSRNFSLANACVELFAKQTGVAMCMRKIDFLQQTLRVGICTFRETKNPNSDYTLFQYSPSYMQLTGYDALSNRFSEQVLEEQRLHLVMAMVDHFWDCMEQQNYLINDYIKSELSNTLIDYIEGGISLHTCHSSRFQAKTGTRLFNLYLYGTAGVGKSSFVKAFRKAFESCLVRFVDASQRVVIVKLPLNSVSPAHLLSILHVKGISDMSIERVIEQTLCKGQVVIFHLEENPEDAETQKQLFDNIQIMLERLTDRYHEYRANIMCFYTSNYEPVPSIVSNVNLLPMIPPNQTSQQLWCERSLVGCVTSYTPFQSASIHFQTPPPYSEDLRPLERWWRSMGFHIIQSIRSLLSQPHNELIFDSQSHVTVHISQNSQDDNNDDNIMRSLSIFISIDQLPLPVSSLLVSSSLFCYSHEVNQKVLTRMEGMPMESHCTLMTVVEMLEHSYVKPAIVMLVGETSQRLRCMEMIRSHLSFLFQDRLRHTEVSLKEEKDKTKVFGEPGEIMGGLFRFMDRVNNPNACEGRSDLFGLILSHVNETGQFILRELVEADPSRTHRQTAHKDRLMFVLSVDEGCSITPQLNSRAHTILFC